MACPFCKHLHGHEAGCRLDGAKGYELVEIIHEMADRLKVWLRVDEEREPTNDAHDATRKLLNMEPLKRVCVTCRFRDLATIHAACLNVHSENSRRMCDEVIGCGDWRKDKR